jgi:hypothetical protein
VINNIINYIIQRYGFISIESSPDSETLTLSIELLRLYFYWYLVFNSICFLECLVIFLYYVGILSYSFEIIDWKDNDDCVCGKSCLMQFNYFLLSDLFELLI